MRKIMRNNITKHIVILAVLVSAVACDLTERMQVQADKSMIFGTESGLATYARSFYEQLPSPASAGWDESGFCDYAACKSMSSFFINGAYNVESSTSWSWGDLHDINYFLDGLKSEYCSVDEGVRQNYEGIARWFRAYFYYSKLTKYGEVPWIDHCLQNYELDYMYKDRDSRDEIIARMIEDLDFAYDHIKATSAIGASTLTKWCAAALKSRVCLFEASYRKYHNLTGMKYSADDLFREAAAAANLIISSGKFSLNMSAGKVGAYRELFANEEPNAQESILAVCCNAESGIYSEQNWHFNSASYGNGNCLSRAFVYTFLYRDGSRFTDQADYSCIEFKDEFTNRDERLAQIVRGPEYKMSGEPRVADIANGVAQTGYHIIKFSLDEDQFDNTNKNYNSTPIIRYAEILLNYAEAKAELGELSADEWASTIGAIRKRAGIEDGGTRPTSLDPYMKETFYPGVTNPVIMEIRRERAIELFFEGFRFDDLRRWACGRLIQYLPWTGIHISALDTPVDVNGDGKYDYFFSESAVPESHEYKAIWVQVNSNPEGLWAVANSVSGYDLERKTVDGRKWYDDDRQYLYPIPGKVIRDYAAEGYTLSQNPNWE